ncbi:MAG: DoxX family protein, partial [Verrucomicrobiota bacterium]
KFGLSLSGRMNLCSGMENISIGLQTLVTASIFFVWVVRYDNIVSEFKEYGLPDWLRDLVGILKLTFSVMLLIGIQRHVFAVVGGIGIAVLMAAAFVTHARSKTSHSKRMPCVALLVISIFIAWANFQLL